MWGGVLLEGKAAVVVAVVVAVIVVVAVTVGVVTGVVVVVVIVVVVAVLPMFFLMCWLVLLVLRLCRYSDHRPVVARLQINTAAASAHNTALTHQRTGSNHKTTKRARWFCLPCGYSKKQVVPEELANGTTPTPTTAATTTTTTTTGATAIATATTAT